MPKSKAARQRRRLRRLENAMSRLRLQDQQPPRNKTPVTRAHVRGLLLLTAALWVTYMPPIIKANETYWAYLPNPPLLHPVTWEDQRIPVYVNDTKTLGLPSSDHIWLQWHAGLNYSGVSMHLPICFSRNNSNCTIIQRVDNMDTNQTVSGIHWDVDMLYPKFNCSLKTAGKPPQRIRPCMPRNTYSDRMIEWRTCHANTSVCNQIICDWTEMGSDCQPTQQVAGLWTGNNHTWQSDLWKLVAAMDYITISRANVSFAPTTGVLSGSGSSWNVSVSACVPEPYALVIGEVQILTDTQGVLTTTCTQCILTNCVNSTKRDVLIVIQPSFVFLPTNITGPWYDDKGLAVLQQAQIQLIRGKRFIGLLIAGITALVTMIATAATAAVALSTGIQTAGYVNQLSANITQVLETQEDWDHKIEQRLNALYDTVQLLGDEIVSIETRSSLTCHAAFTYVCVTPVRYNASRYEWEKVKNQLNGIWHNSNTSLDIRELHNEIQALASAPRLNIDIAKEAQNFLYTLSSTFPSMRQWGTQLIGLCVIGIGLIVLCMILLCCCRMMLSQFSQIWIKMTRLNLEQDKNKNPLITSI